MFSSMPRTACCTVGEEQITASQGSSGASSAPTIAWRVLATAIPKKVPTRL